jgi:hypothetical protein
MLITREDALVLADRILALTNPSREEVAALLIEVVEELDEARDLRNEPIER